EAAGQVLGKGYSPVDYALFCYGGGGPLHVAGYTNKGTYRDVLVPAWAAGIQQAWDALKARVAAEFEKSGVLASDVGYRFFARMQYYGQLNDIEIYSPAQQLGGVGDIDALI